MVLKVICVLAAAVVAVSTHYAHSSIHIDRHDGHHQEVFTHDKHGHHHVDYYAYPKYKFEYKVDDDHTGDHKQQKEHRDGHDTDSKYSWHIKHIVPKKYHEGKEDKKETKKHTEVKHQHSEYKHKEEISKDHHEGHKHQQEKSIHHVLVDYYAYPKYEFGYKVNDPHTGDKIEQHEHRDGHNTKSDYSLHLKHVVPKHY